MSLQAAAKHLASKGRGPDTHLVHMAPSEVAALQKLAKQHGGSLTINPDTGLPEAGFLSSILPVALGAASTFFTGTPYLGMALAGGLSYAKSGSLMQGLTAGLGAYGGGQLASGLAGLGTSEAGAAVSQAAETQGVAAAQEAAAQRAAEMSAQQSSLLGQTLTPQQIEAQVGQTIKPYTDLELGGIRQDVANAYMPNAAQQAAMANPYATGISAALKDPSKLVGAMGGGKEVAKAGLMALAPMMAQTPKMPGMAKPDSDMGQRYRYNPGVASPFPGASPTGVEQNYYPGSGYAKITNEQAKQLYGYADGGMTYGQGDAQGDPNLMQVKTYEPVVRMAEGGAFDFGNLLGGDGGGTGGGATSGMRYDPSTQTYSGGAPTSSFGDSGSGLFARLLRGASDSGNMGSSSYTYDPGTQRYTSTAPVETGGGVADVEPNITGAAGGGLMAYAMGGQSHLGDYSDGGRLLRGPGDGVSDSIPATIGGKRPARLADGEFVVPARIVSELGNGSTEAGARKLYAMMDRVQGARSKTTGKNRVAKNTNAAKYLPA